MSSLDTLKIVAQNGNLDKLLSTAVENNQLEHVKYLIQCGAIIDHHYHITYVIIYGYLDILIEFLKHTLIDIQETLSFASQYDNFNIIEYIVQEYPSTNPDDYLDILYHSAMRGDVKVIRLILNNVSLNNDMYIKLVDGSIYTNNKEVIDLIIQVSPQNKISTLTTIYKGYLNIFWCSPNFIKLLLSYQPPKEVVQDWVILGHEKSFMHHESVKYLESFLEDYKD